MLAERATSFWLGQSTVAGQANLGLIASSVGAVDSVVGWVPKTRFAGTTISVVEVVGQ